MALTQKQVIRMKCLTLLDAAAEGDSVAAEEISYRANSWNTCAVGECADKLQVSPYALYSADPVTIEEDAWHGRTSRLEHLGVRFAKEVNIMHYRRAKRTYHAIANRVKKLFGTKVKRQKLGLS